MGIPILDFGLRILDFFGIKLFRRLGIQYSFFLSNIVKDTIPPVSNNPFMGHGHFAKGVLKASLQEL